MDHDFKAVLIVAICVGAPFLMLMVYSLMKMIETSTKTHYDAMLKMKMIERGYTADEIERVCQAKIPDGAQHDPEWKPIPPAKPVEKPAAW